MNHLTLMKRALSPIARGVLAIAVFIIAGKQLLDALAKLDDPKVVFYIDYLSYGAVFYALGMAMFSLFWWRVTVFFGGHMARMNCHRTYFLSQLGKYLPGKAWVIVIRCALIPEDHLSLRVVAVSSLYETLTIMGSGALLSFMTLLVLGVGPKLLWLAFGLGVTLLALAHPPLSHWLAIFSLRCNSQAKSLSLPSWKTLWKVIPIILLGWFLVGLSFVMAGFGIGNSFKNLYEMFLAMAGAGLAITAGFAVFVTPAGLGVREWVLMQLLGPSIGTGQAALVAIAVRGLQVASELCIGISFYFFRKGVGERA